MFLQERAEAYVGLDFLLLFIHSSYSFLLGVHECLAFGQAKSKEKKVINKNKFL